MDQIVGKRETKLQIIDRIKKEYNIAILRGESDENTVFTIQDNAMQGIQSILLTPCIAAMRRSPLVTGLKRPLCMADIERVGTNRISADGIKECFMSRLMSGVLEFQNRMSTPFCFMETGSMKSEADLFRHFGFHYIYDRPQYEWNTDIISKEKLARAAAGENVSLDRTSDSDVILQLAGREDMLSLAHFVNARLCRQYGLFIVRNASYFERFQEELQSIGGNLYQIMENGIRKGYFACTGGAAGIIQEAVFDSIADRERYLIEREDKKPSVMARITNMTEMLRHITGNGKITIAIRIKDSILAENDGLFRWYIDESGSRMERVEQADGNMERDASMRPEVTTTIGEFTAFVFEYIKLKQNAKFDSIYLSGPVWINEMKMGGM